jgi:hypothetical protein
LFALDAISASAAHAANAASASLYDFGADQQAGSLAPMGPNDGDEGEASDAPEYGYNPTVDAATFSLGFLAIAFSATKFRSVDLDAAVFARIGVILCFIPVAQAAVRILRDTLRECFKIPLDLELNKPKNRRPPLILGIAENILLPWLLYDSREAAITVIGAWIGIKALGNWSEWQTGEPKDDPHRGRRVMYIFLLCNASQIFFAFVAAGAMRCFK